MIVIQEKTLYWFNISDCYLEWKLIRLIWIGFYKSNCNCESYFARLSKDLVLHVIKFVGNVRLDENNKQHCLKLV